MRKRYTLYASHDDNILFSFTNSYNSRVTTVYKNESYLGFLCGV